MENNNLALSYNESLAELEKILAELRADNCDVDLLAERPRRAAQLLSACRARLTRTEEDLAKVLDELDSAIDA